MSLPPFESAGLQDAAALRRNLGGPPKADGANILYLGEH